MTDLPSARHVPSDDFRADVSRKSVDRRRSRRRSTGLLVVRRLAALPVAVFVVVSLAFVLVNALPSNPARTALGPLASPEAIAEFEHKAGLDQGMWHRYVDYLGNLAHGDLGTSYYSPAPVTDQIVRYLASTIELAVLSLIVAVLLGTGVGILSAYSRRLLGGAARLFTAVTQAIPDFALGLLLIFVIFFVLGWAPAPLGQAGAVSVESFGTTHAVAFDALIHGQWQVLGTALAHLVLPVATLGIFYSAIFSRMVAALLGKALRSPQIDFARACGLPERRVIWYALLDVRAPIVTYIAILSGFLIGGEAVIETVFAWNGLGQWALSGVLQVDLPVIQGFILVATTMTLIIYLLLDVVAQLIDPRLRQVSNV